MNVNMVAEQKVRSRRSKLQDQGPSPNAGQCRQAASRRRCESDPQSHKETTSMLNEKRSEKVTDEEMDEMIEIVEVVCSITQERIPRNESQSRLRHGHVARSRQLKQ